MSWNFKLGDEIIAPAKTYCYLGITFSLNGSFRMATDSLTAKATRALFQLKKTVDIKALSFNSLFILFDSLIKPIAGYASQIWLPDTYLFKELLKLASGEVNDLIKAAARDKIELLHLRFLKWCLGLHRKASNV